MKDKNIVIDMYGSDDDSTVIADTMSSVQIKKKGTVNEIVMNQETLLVPDMSLSERLLNMIKDLQKKISILEQNSRSQSSHIYQLERNIQKLMQELDKKISYE